MAEYPQYTPAYRARGRFKLRPPFAVSDSIDYTCIAIRSFAELYREGTNPYTTIYVPNGLSDGTVIDDVTFNFSREEIRGINIITLADDQGRAYLVPDNYILSYPSSTTIVYREMILSCSLGALPENIDLSSAQEAVVTAVNNAFGITPTVASHSLATTTNPTYEQHLALEQARIASIKSDETAAAKINQLRADIAYRDNLIQTLSKILIDNNLMPSI